MRYTRKYHTTTAENLTTDWMGPRIYRPSLEEVLRGALSPTAPQVHYITHFRYPRYGGFVSYLRKFIPLGNINLNHQIVSIDPRERLLTFSNGVVAHYDALISSLRPSGQVAATRHARPSEWRICRTGIVSVMAKKTIHKEGRSFQPAAHRRIRRAAGGGPGGAMRR